MKSSFFTLPLIFTVLLAQSPATAEQFLLYTPKPVAGDHVPASPDQGVLVKRVTVKRGDTLAHLSRKHIGVGSWFPQVLLFNRVKNPDLIYAGDNLWIPVSAQRGASVKKSAKAKKNHAGHHVARPRSFRPQPVAADQETQAKPDPLDLQESFLRAKGAYLQGDYHKAQALFADFLKRFPQSDLAADVSLYQADCFLRMSGL